MHITQHELLPFLIERFDEVHELWPLADGWWSQAFSFIAADRKLVVRISRKIRDFQKDVYAYFHFNSPAIVIPEVLETGRFNDEFFYCVTALIEGTPADALIESLNGETRNAAASAILEPLYHIHRVDVSNMKGWGYVNENGVGVGSSWPAFLSSVYNNKNETTWQEFARTSFLDGELFANLHRRMESFYPCLPATKQLLHGDYGFDNLLMNKDPKATAVLDWAEMMLGDEVYDLVHMNEPWRDEEVQFYPIWKKYMDTLQRELPYLGERLQCYRIHYTLMHMHIYTVVNDEEGYAQIAQWARRHLL
ncbi:MAG TPA: aminoglycoside phosphotransferase family protein [Chitinophaga sp.]|uniref:phosphotransferase family protein n=1 Tax=Chitinophaga sp. TaxID=1869181 RepID=UPI002B5B297B|nr:aminoglycoside phosphotransferase family protein [Chitinophaga sp.]HVI48814.1 aminoglycoside phosphotransferase family protein [Chitinophaga sp.]